MKAFLNRYIKLGHFIVGLFLGAVFVNKFGLNFFQTWQLEYNQIATDYLKVLLALPSVVLIVSLFFFTKFSSAIDFLIRNLKVKYKDIEATSQQAKNILPSDVEVTEETQSEIVSLSKQDAQEIAAGIQNLQTDNQTKQQTINQLQEVVGILANRAELFEFKYLNGALVLNTRVVLRDLYRIGSMTRESFVRSIAVPANVTDVIAEQLAIHNALLVNGLIEENGSLLSVSEKGERYLKFSGLINT